MSITRQLKRILFGARETQPDMAYDWWSTGYDDQPNNLMLAMDEEVFTGFLNETEVKANTVVDIGCGTGRHWKKIMEKRPGQLIGYDISEGMLEKLKMKFPKAIVHKINDHRLPELKDNSCDIIISTLTIAHIPNPKKALAEWSRVLKPGGDLIITDYHPTALARGGKRTFSYQGKIIAVKNYIHSIEKLRSIAGQLHWRELRFSEKIIDESVKDYYERQNALDIYERFNDTPIIYGIHFKKSG